MIKVVVLFVFVFAIVKASEFVQDQGILVLSRANFEEARKQYDNLLVEFYVPWCGHCKSMAPEYVKAAQALGEKGVNIQLAKVDAEQEAELRKEFEITSYPTFKLFIKSKSRVLDYSAGRHANDIVTFIEKKIGQPAKQVQSVDEAKKLIDEESFLLFAFTTSAEVTSAFEQVAFDNDKYVFAITSSSALLSEFHINEDTIIAFKKYDEGRSELKGDITYKSISRFLLDHHLPLVNEFREENAEKIFSTGIDVHSVLFIKKSDEHFTNHYDSFKEAAFDFRGRVVFLLVDIGDDDNHKVLEFFGMGLEECPTVRFVNLSSPSDPIKYNPTSTDLSKKSIHDFVDGVLKGKIQPFFKSQQVPSDWNDKPVKVLVAKNFQQVVDEALKSKTVIVLFYAPWCGHCKKLEPVWDQLGEKYQQNSNVLVAKVDSTTNELENLDIKAFPTIKLFLKGSKNVIDFSGERTLEALSAFVDSEGKVIQVPEINVPQEPPKDEL